MKFDVYSIQGQKTGEIELADDIFNIEPHEHAMYLSVRAYLANRRQGTHKTKGRSEVRGGGKKPWKQKGRGTARSGTSRSPLWVGGGNVHGPKPHSYNLDIPKKVKRLARKSALSLRARESNLIIVEDFASTGKTKEVASMLKALNLYGERVLQLLPEAHEQTVLSSRNIDGLTTMYAPVASTYDILRHKKLLVHKSAVEKIAQTFGN